MSGLYGKFAVFKDHKEVKDCFVLRPYRDDAARAAIHAYADAIEGTNWRLAIEIRDKWPRHAADEERHKDG